MTEESKAKQPDQTSKDSKTDGNPGTKESPRNKKAERQGTRGKKW